MTDSNDETLMPACRWCGQTTLPRYALEWPAIDDCGNCQTTTTRGRGRPSTGTPVMVRIPPHVLAVIDAMADDQGRTRADLVREKLTRYALQASMGRRAERALNLLQELVEAAQLTPDR